MNRGALARLPDNCDNHKSDIFVDKDVCESICSGLLRRSGGGASPLTILGAIGARSARRQS